MMTQARREQLIRDKLSAAPAQHATKILATVHTAPFFSKGAGSAKLRDRFIIGHSHALEPAASQDNSKALRSIASGFSSRWVQKIKEKGLIDPAAMLDLDRSCTVLYHYFQWPCTYNVGV